MVRDTYESSQELDTVILVDENTDIGIYLLDTDGV